MSKTEFQLEMWDPASTPTPLWEVLRKMAVGSKENELHSPLVSVKTIGKGRIEGFLVYEHFQNRGLERIFIFKSEKNATVGLKGMVAEKVWGKNGQQEALYSEIDAKRLLPNLSFDPLEKEITEKKIEEIFLNTFQKKDFKLTTTCEQALTATQARQVYENWFLPIKEGREEDEYLNRLWQMFFKDVVLNDPRFTPDLNNVRYMNDHNETFGSDYSPWYCYEYENRSGDRIAVVYMMNVPYEESEIIFAIRRTKENEIAGKQILLIRDRNTNSLELALADIIQDPQFFEFDPFIPLNLEIIEDGISIGLANLTRDKIRQLSVYPTDPKKLDRYFTALYGKNA